MKPKDIVLKPGEDDDEEEIPPLNRVQHTDEEDDLPLPPGYCKVKSIRTTRSLGIDEPSEVEEYEIVAPDLDSALSGILYLKRLNITKLPPLDQK